MDLVTETPRVPAIGETVLGTGFSTLPGGKGANQAVACARLGAHVTMVGCVGNDGFGAELVQRLQEENVNVDYVEPITHTATGIASIVVENGDNSIIVVPGANHAVTPEKVRQAEAAIKQADVVLLQLEIPLAAVAEAIQIAGKYGVPVVLNPAPATALPAELLAGVAVVTPNEYELAMMLGRTPEQADDFREMMQVYSGSIMMTKGGDGAYYKQKGSNVVHQPGFQVNVVDTTGAGDTCNAALAVMMGRGADMDEAIRYAVAASALSVTKFGAQGGMPTQEEVEQFLGQMKE